jgi:hypothetical protein
MVLLAGSLKAHATYGKNSIFDVSTPAWARILALPDPSGNGARRVADAEDALSSLRLISLERRSGQAPVVRLLQPSGSGKPFVDPGAPYVRIPLDLWVNRWIWHLSGSELAVLIALIDLCGGKGRNGIGGAQSLMAVAPDRYGMSEDTWRLASSRLAELGLVTTERLTVRVDLNTPRVQKVYELKLDTLETPAPQQSVD